MVRLVMVVSGGRLCRRLAAPDLAAPSTQVRSLRPSKISKSIPLPLFWSGETFMGRKANLTLIPPQPRLCRRRRPTAFERAPGTMAGAW
jgi:hypothetical protein